MKTIEELAREAGLRNRDAWVPGIASARLVYSENWNGVTDKDLARFRDLVLEEAAKVCDATPPQPFRPSIEAAHAIRALKDKA